MTTIYFSHSKPDYNTEYELNCINEIKNRYPDAEIINPKDIKISDNDKVPLSGRYNYFMKMMSKYYFSEIDKCDLLIVAKSKSGKYSSGVKKEIEYANSINKSIEDLEVPYPELNTPTFPIYYIRETGLGIFHGDNNSEEIDVGSAIDFLEEYGTDIEFETENDGIKYLVFYDNQEDGGIPGLAIPEVTYNFLEHNGQIVKTVIDNEEAI